MADIRILQTALFARQIKKLHPNQVGDLDRAVRRIIENPAIGEQKKGDLAGAWVHKSGMVNQQCLLAYQWTDDSRTLLSFGMHENFYRDLKGG